MLNDMTISLLVIGALIIVFVIGYNRFQASRMKQPKHSSQPPSQQSDTEPSIDSSLHDTATTQPDFEINPYAGDAVQQHEDADRGVIETDADAHADALDDLQLTESTDHEMSQPVDVEPSKTSIKLNLPASVFAEIDSIVQFDLSSEIHQQSLLEDLISKLMPPAGLQSMLQIFALSEAGEWHHHEQLQANARYQRLILALQLVSRDGPISEQNVQQFSKLVEYLEKQLDCHAEWIANAAMLEMANELDQFCISVDKTLKLHLLHGNAGRFTGTKFRGLAESSGLQLQQGVFVYLGDQAQTLYTIENIERNPFNADMLRTVVLKGVSFQLDIPRTAKCAETFNIMLQTAKKMETALSGIFVDDQQREIAEVQLERIRQQLKLIQTQMLTRGIPSGSDAALRLFK